LLSECSGECGRHCDDDKKVAENVWHRKNHPLISKSEKQLGTGIRSQARRNKHDDGTSFLRNNLPGNVTIELPGRILRELDTFAFNGIAD